MREAHSSSTTVVPCFFDLEGVRIMCLWQELRSMKTSAKQTVRIIYTVYWRMCTGWKHHTSCTVLREEKLICRAIATSAKLTWPGYETFRDCLVARCMHESTRRQLYDNYTTTYTTTLKSTFFLRKTYIFTCAQYHKGEDFWSQTKNSCTCVRNLWEMQLSYRLSYRLSYSCRIVVV